jgi:hypothetical protein
MVMIHNRQNAANYEMPGVKSVFLMQWSRVEKMDATKLGRGGMT